MLGIGPGRRPGWAEHVRSNEWAGNVMQAYITQLVRLLLRFLRRWLCIKFKFAF